MKFYQLIFILFLCQFLSCSTSKSIISLNDPMYFQEFPKIVFLNDRYFLKWKSSEKLNGHFYMYSESKVENGKLLFFIPATTSTGNRIGKLHFEEIKTKIKLELIKGRMAFWKEPNGNLNSLNIETLRTEDSILIQEKFISKTH